MAYSPYEPVYPETTQTCNYLDCLMASLLTCKLRSTNVAYSQETSIQKDIRRQVLYRICSGEEDSTGSSLWEVVVTVSRIKCPRASRLDVAFVSLNNIFSYIIC